MTTATHQPTHSAEGHASPTHLRLQNEKRSLRIVRTVITGEGDVRRLAGRYRPDRRTWEGRERRVAQQLEHGGLREIVHITGALEASVMLGHLPDDTSSVTFKALQTYSNGGNVRWIDIQQPGQPAPDHPAPAVVW